MPIESESARLFALESYDVLDSAPEEAFDRLTALAADLFDVPIALVSLVDSERQWFKSRTGLDVQSTPREWAFCAHAIEQEPDTTMVVEDASRDPRFLANPLVVGEPNIRFYAGAVLTGREGANLGALCIIDTKARPTPSDADLRRLRVLARLVVDELEQRRSTRLAAEKRRLLDMAEQMSGVGHWRHHVSTGKTTWSDEIYRIHGVSRNEFDPDYDGAVGCYHPDDQAKVSELLTRAVETGKDFDCELRIKRPDGEERDVRCRATTTYGSSGRVDAVYGVLQDITDQKQMLLKLEAGGKSYKLLADNAADVIRAFGLDGVSRYVSPSIQTLMGFSPEEAVAIPSGKQIHPDDLPKVRDLLTEMREGRETATLQYRIWHRDGRLLWVEAAWTLVRDAAGAPDEIVSVIRDISEHKALESALTEARDKAEEYARRASFAETVAGLGHWRLDVKTRAITWSDQMYRIYGLEQGSHVDVATLQTLYHPDDAELNAARIAQIEAGTTSTDTITRIRLRDGSVRWLRYNSKAEHAPDGDIVAMVGTVHDITDQREAELAVLESEAKYRTLAEHSTDILVRIGPDGLIRYVSPACRRLGLDPEDEVGRPAARLIAPDHMEYSAAILKALFSGAEIDTSVRRRHKIVAPDGREVWLEGNPTLVRDAHGKVVEVVTVIRDVTAAHEIEAALAQSERRFRSLTTNAPDMISEMTLDGTLTYVSPASLAILGFTPEEMLGRTPFSFMHPEDAGRVREMCRVVFESRGAVEPWSVEYRAYHKDGGERWMESKPTFVADPVSGRFVGINDVMRDVTAHKALEAELRLAQTEAEAAVAVKTEFLANMSHELRTPLTSIIGFTGLAAEQPELAPLTRNYVERVGDASRALLCTVNDILDFSKLEAGQVVIAPQPTPLAPLARATLDLFTPQAAAKDLALDLDGEAEDLTLSIDPDRIRQVLLNFVSNAVKFTEAGGVTLRTRHDGESLRVEVIDTGAGIAPDKLSQLFQRFSQVDGGLTRAGGTGLGLAICKGLVEAMGGDVGVDSVVGQGSCFWFSIPAPPAQAPHAATVGSAATQPTFAGVRVLVADDHPANRELVRLFLAGVGAEVSEACDGQQAAEMAAEMPYDVILMDMRMPNLDGPGALRAIRGQPGPNDVTPILAFTADAGAEADGAFIAMGFQDVVSKPVTPAALITAVIRATDFSPLTLELANAG